MTEKHPRILYDWIPEVERLDRYEPGGYHPIMIGDVLQNRYHIVDKLGHGGYSTVWLVQDTQKSRYVALKINTASAPPREAKALSALSAPSTHPGREAIPSFLDEFEVEGPNGRHTCYTSSLAACHLRDISFSRLFPLDVSRALIYRLAQAVEYVHSKGYVHGDIHLNNILAKLPVKFHELSVVELYKKYGDPETVPVTRQDGEPLPPNAPEKAVVPLFLGKYAEEFLLADACLLLSDFGEAFSPALEPRLGKDCHIPPAFRAPETDNEPEVPFAYPSDIWSLATAIWEIIGMQALFTTECIPAEQIRAQQFDVLGPLPSDWWWRWDGRKVFFNDDGSSTDSYRLDKWRTLDESFEHGIRGFRQKKGDKITDEEKGAFLDLMRRMLAFRPGDRMTSTEVLNSEWMVKWALPDYERSLKETSVSVT
ncbi:kinase-like domain-containing protein [Aspergillus californicus]